MKSCVLMQDAMCVARNILKNPKLLPGGGATELTVSATLKQKSSSVEGVEKVILFLFALSIDDQGIYWYAECECAKWCKSII
jgi:chaperonin GroEL (HSP60 family)